MSELPPGWITVRLRDVATDITYGYTASASEQKNGPRFLRITDIQNERVNWNVVPYCTCDHVDKYLLKVGDIVVARTGATTGKSFLVTSLPESAVFASYLIRIQPGAAIQSEYLGWFMRSPSYWDRIATVSKGTAQPGANASILAELEIPLAPLQQQRRVASKIESLTAKSRRAKEALEEARYLEEKLVEYYTFGWPESVLGEYIETRNELAGDIWQDYPTVGLSNDGKITDRRESIGAKTAEKCKVVRFGDIVFNPIRFSIGSIARYHGLGPAIVSPEYQVFRCKPSISSELLVRYLRTARGRSLLDTQTQGSVRYRVYFRTLEQLRVQLAPPKLQAQAEHILGCLRRVWASIGEVQELLPHLERAILAKAFRGELVPQDPNDEPASVLLERLRAERERSLAAPNGQSKAKPRTRKFTSESTEP